ncbi:MAG: SMP-30/gluconolactonase/LRE family protein [Novosphingobium sp.]
MIETTLAMREVTTGLCFPEGPIAMADGSVIVVEIESGKLIRVQPDGAKSVAADVGGGPNGAAIGPDGHCYVCNNGGFKWLTEPDGYLRPIGRSDAYAGGSIQRVDLASGAVETLYDAGEAAPLKAPNDIVFDADGGFWFTDFGGAHERVLSRGAVYYARTDGSFIKEAAFPMITPNGIGLSPDGKMLYVAESDSGKFWAWPVLGPGELAKEPWPAPAGGKFLNGVRGFQRYDSLAMEAGGNICVATMGAGGVAAGISVYAPNGELLEFYRSPEFYCTNIAFGGPDMRTAWITLSGYGKLVEVAWPRPGLKLLHQQ